MAGSNYTGCKRGTTSPKKKGSVSKPYMTGHNITQSRGLVTFYATPKNENAGKTSNPDIDQWVVTIKVHNTFQTVLTTGLYNVKTKLLTMPEWNMLADAKKDYWVTLKDKNKFYDKKR